MPHSRVELPEPVKNRFKAARMIQFALLGSTLLYGVVAHVIHLGGEEPTALSGGGDDLQVTFSILGLGMCFFASLFNQSWLKRLKREAKTKGTQARSVTQINRLVGALFTGSIITWALAESCAVFGFVLSFMLSDGSHYTLFGVLSFLTILAHPLSETSVRRVLDER